MQAFEAETLSPRPTEQTIFPWFLALCLLYPIGRYVSENASVVISIALLFFIIITIFKKIENMRALGYVAPPFMLIALAAVATFSSGDITSFRYIIFCGIYVLLAFAVFFAGDGSQVSYQAVLVLLVTIICSAFWAFPQLPQYDDFTLVNYFIDENERTRLRAIFAHANDLGMSAAAMAIMMLYGLRKGQAKFPRMLLIAATVSSLGLVFASRSSTGYFILLSGILWRTMPGIFVRAFLIVCFLLLAALQLRFYDVALDVLQSGSFWWRFTMAERVDVLSNALSFSPTMLASQETWTHSLLLDVSIVYGRIAVYSAVLSLLWLGISGKTHIVIAVFIPLVAACVQPPGATPASFYIIIVVCFSLAHRQASTQNVLSDSPPPTDTVARPRYMT